jgi:hypothetical protein
MSESVEERSKEEEGMGTLHGARKRQLLVMFQTTLAFKINENHDVVSFFFNVFKDQPGLRALNCLCSQLVRSELSTMDA